MNWKSLFSWGAILLFSCSVLASSGKRLLDDPVEDRDTKRRKIEVHPMTQYFEGTKPETITDLHVSVSCREICLYKPGFQQRTYFNIDEPAQEIPLLFNWLSRCINLTGLHFDVLNKAEPAGQELSKLWEGKTLTKLTNVIFGDEFFDSTEGIGATIKGINSLPSLTCLTLSGLGFIKSTDWGQFCHALKKNTSLIELTFDDIRIQSDNELIDNFHHNLFSSLPTTTTKLVICQEGDDEMSPVIASEVSNSLAVNRHLKKFALNHPLLIDETALMILKAINHNTTLTELNLFGNNITVVGLNLLTTFLQKTPMTMLKKLDLQNNYFQEDDEWEDDPRSELNGQTVNQTDIIWNADDI